MPVLLADNFPPEHGGIQRYMERLAGHLAKTQTVVVVAPYVDGCGTYDRSLPYTVIRYAQRSRLVTLLGLFLAYLKALRTTRDYTVTALWNPSGLVAVCTPGPLRGRLGILAHGREIEADRGGFRQRLMRFVYGRADAVIANSAFTAALLRRAGVKEHVHVVHCGVDDVAVTRRRAATPIIVAVGRLVRRKGFDRLIEAMPAILARFPETRFEIVGDGTLRGELESRCAALGITNSVLFHGALDDSGLADAYARAWCFALPVRSIGADVEGFGIVYLEAAVAGLASIGGRHSGAEDAIADGKTGFLVDGDDPEQIAAKIIELFDDPARAEDMGRAGRRRALETFSWPLNASRIDALMRLS